MSGSPLQPEKTRCLLHFGVAVLVVLFGVRAVGTPWALSAFPIVALGVYAASHAFARLARIQAIEREMLANARTDFAHEFRRSTLPRQIYWLLLAIAEADGEAGEKEQRMVREFLIERFPAEHVRDIATWHAQRVNAPLHTLAAGLRLTLTRSETETLFFWACLVAFVDERFNDVEQAALKDAARGLGLDPTHARRIFWHAKYAYLGADARPGQAGQQRAQHKAGSTSARQRALGIMGLDETAGPEDIRKRHRELAKKFHPDRHQHLGEAAAKEAATRFRQVQAAYEELRR